MADICCGGVGETSSPSTSDGSSTQARRRRMEIKQLKLIASNMAIPLPESNRKRRKVDSSCDSSSESSEDDVVLDKEKSRFGLTVVCGRRRDLEDAVAVKPSFCKTNTPSCDDLHFYGVYDGHGCSHVAMNCKDRMHDIVKEEVEKCEKIIKWKEIMVKIVAVVALDKIVVSNCGDSRAVLCRNGVAIPLSTDHKPDRADELERIEEAGGRVIFWDGARVLGVLAMSRAIGDSYLKPYVIPEPEVTVTERTGDDECLIIASDGLWDVVSNDVACRVARMCLRSGEVPSPPRSDDSPFNVARGESSDKACSDASILLTRLALARQSSDNVSVLVVDLRRDL
ncbi:hypothetical protein M8C21_000498 [Ambrosia artemisiifolia]|uniref:protein-serine/threonine phosphatase n=1 Tax=Ambrosia artemisiifolia TaxID=4212 RepID=A0AAD5CDR0_AMBAR|nr:hypothetical protein M8C21_000498 [Ambrosia artemisiifolia]